jgi:hypothetical protein
MNKLIKAATTSSIPTINRIIKQDDMFRHYKGSIYRVNMIAKHTENEENLVIYHDIRKPEQIWARPITMFNEYVEIDGDNKLRFESIAE